MEIRTPPSKTKISKTKPKIAARSASKVQLLEQPTREAKTQLNLFVYETDKRDFQVYCAQIGKGKKQGEVFAEIFRFYQEHHSL